jgi:thiamine biosynthesis protein ThiI
MAAISCTDAAAGLPVLRPLIGMDKAEIIGLARKIDTFDISIEPYEDCCTIFTPRHPKTKPSIEDVIKAEEKVGALPELEALAAENYTVKTPRAFLDGIEPSRGVRDS